MKITLRIVATILVLTATVCLPYIFYIGLRYGWGDDRIDYAGLGLPVLGLALLLMKIEEDLRGGRNAD